MFVILQQKYGCVLTCTLIGFCQIVLIYIFVRIQYILIICDDFILLMKILAIIRHTKEVFIDDCVGDQNCWCQHSFLDKNIF